MKKVLLLVAVAVIFTSGCVVSYTGRTGAGYGQYERATVNCAKYSTEKARNACEKGKEELKKEDEEREASQAYNEGRGKVANPQGGNTQIYIDPFLFAPPIVVAPVHSYYPYYPRYYPRYRRW